MKPRRPALLLTLLLAISVSLGTAVLVRRREAPGVAPVTALPVFRAPPVVDALPAAQDPGAPAPAEPVKESEGRGWLRVTLEIPEELRQFSVHAVVLTPGTSVEQSEEFSDVAQFLLGPLKPGTKVVLLYTMDGRIGAAAAVTDVVEGSVTDLSIRPPKPMRLQGVVVDSSGHPQANIEVEVTETLPLENFRMAGGVGVVESAGIGVGGAGGSSSSRGGGFSYSYWLSSEGVQFSLGSKIDPQGRFSLWLRSGPSPVSVRILRNYKPVMEQAVVPTSGALRLVIPDPVEAPKK